jgi:hypothetical protein
MRFILFAAIVLLLFSCRENKRIVKRIEGTWLLKDILLNDGQHLYPNDIYVFGKGESDGVTYSGWTKYPADYSDTISGKYLVMKKGDYIILRNESVIPVQADTCTIDDMDSEMLIFRSNLGVHYLYKQ